LLLFVVISPARGTDDAVDSIMYRSPELPQVTQVPRFTKGLIPLWLEALARPEVESQRQVALSIALAHRLGIKGLETTVAPLVQALERTDDPGVRLAIVSALVKLDARDTAPQLFKLSQTGDSDLRDLIEPALARWDYQPARAVWLERLGQPEPVRASLLLAIHALGQVRDAKAVPRLRELVLARRTPASVRLEAARALGSIRSSGSEKDARSLAADNGPQGIVQRLAAAALLRHHAGADTIGILQQLATDAEPTVSAAALERLVEIDPKLVLPVLPRVLPNPDAKVQLNVLKVLNTLATQEHIRLLADKLDHEHPDVRNAARRYLQQLAASPERRDYILQQGTRLLNATGWRGQEQSAILLASFDYVQASDRLLVLLSSSRPEAAVTAAWGLRRLAVPATQAPILAYVTRCYELLLGRKPLSLPMVDYDRQLSHLVQFLGQSRYQPSEALIRQLLPRPLDTGNPAGTETRAAAAWALGFLNEKKPDPEVIVALESRLKDLGGGARRPPEERQVRWESAISLGRMKARVALGSLRRFYAKKASLDPVSNACGWALEQITGEKMPPPEIAEYPVERWFLTPLKTTNPEG